MIRDTQNKGVTTMEYRLYSNYIQYERMYHLTAQSFSYSDSNTINVYIDMGSMISNLYHEFEILNIKNYSVVTSSIINLCAHIRDYFRTRHRVETKIFIVYSTNTPDYNRHCYYGYNNKNYEAITNNKILREMIQTNIDMLKLLCQYLPDIYFINSNWETSVLIYDIILQEQANGNIAPSMIYSKDQYIYQIPANMTQVAIYRPKKSQRDINTGMIEDISWAVTNNSVLYKFLSENRKVDMNKIEDLNPNLLSLLMCLSNCTARGIKSIFNISTALKLLKQMVSEYQIQNAHVSNIESVYDYLFINNLFKPGNSYNLDKQLFIDRYHAIDIISQHQVYFNAPDKIVNYKINLHDPEAVKTINNKYFIENPLDLNRL